MKIGFWEVFREEERLFFQEELKEHELTFFEKPLDSDNLPQDFGFDAISIFVSSKITPQTINLFPNLKFISVRATGFDSVDLETAKAKNILVSNVPSYGSHTVAEFTFGLILALSRKIYQGVNRIKVGAQFNFEGLRGFDLAGKTLGVVGVGKIGVNVIKIAQGFGMEILACDSQPNPAANYQYTNLEELLRNSDIVSLHVPYMKETHHLINKENIFLMKKGALLINTARGAVVDTEALFQALMQNHLGGAALDVLEEEAELKEEAELLTEGRLTPEQSKTILENHILMDLPNVLITPHMAFYSREAEHSIWETTVKNIKGALSGNPENIVNQ